MNQESTALYNLLEDIAVDNPTFDFPFTSITNELDALYFGQAFFDEHVELIKKKLDRKFNVIVSHVFMLCLVKSFPLEDYIYDQIPPDLYYESAESLIELLQTIKITRIEKDSPDGQMMTEMS